jgi:DNA-binding CsgD family transcriptional regulator
VNEVQENTIRRGALTPRQYEILAALVVGERYDDLAKRMIVSRQVITNDVTFAARKLGCKTSREVVARYATYLAYNRAAEMLRGGKVVVPIEEAEVHVNHVLEGMAAELTQRAAALVST